MEKEYIVPLDVLHLCLIKNHYEKLLKKLIYEKKVQHMSSGHFIIFKIFWTQ
jgi:hypothetical protein